MDNISLITIDKNIVGVKTSDISKFAEVEHETVLSLIRTHRKSLREFENLNSDFKSEFKLSQFLNKEQCYFLITLMRNSPNIVRFKKQLIKDFFRYEKLITSQSIDIAQNILKQKDMQLKIANKQTEDATRKKYAHTREGNFQCVTNIIKDIGAKISAETLNKILLSKEYVKQKEVLAKKYVSNDIHSINSLDGSILFHYDTVIDVLKEYEVVFTEDTQMSLDFS